MSKLRFNRQQSWRNPGVHTDDASNPIRMGSDSRDLHMVDNYTHCFDDRATAEVKASEGSASTVLRVFMLVYALIIFASDITVRIVRQLPNEAQAKRCVRGSRKRYEKCDEGILEKIKSKLLNCVSLAVLFKLLFSILASAVLVLKITNLDIRGPVWIKGFFLLFGWLMLLSH